MKKDACSVRRASRRSNVMVAGAVAAAVLALLPVPVSAGGEPAGSFEIPAWAFDRGNARTFTQQYADGGPMVANGGTLPWVVEYDIEFPVAASYTLQIRYAAANSRPVNLLLDGKSIGPCCRKVTGSWNTSSAQWEEAGKLTFGSHRSKMVERIRHDPCKGGLTREAFIRLVTWIDANAPYYGVYEGKKNIKWKGTPDFRLNPIAGK